VGVGSYKTVCLLLLIVSIKFIDYAGWILAISCDPVSGFYRLR
jgi:hypothetical protein